LHAARALVQSRFLEAQRAGRLDFPFKAGLGFYEYPRPGVLHFNATRMGGATALNAARLTELEIEGRRQAALLCAWLRAEAPCFERAYLDAIAPRVGVRETRRIQGRYRMTRQDVLDGARFADGIARSAYFIDIHNPSGAVDAHAAPAAGAPPGVGFKPRRYYEIPLRCLQPPGVENLLVACRALSSDHYAHAATRVMGTLTAVGEAAGLATAHALAGGQAVSAIDGAAIRERLGYLDAPLTF
jgi:hypothetical protein